MERAVKSIPHEQEQLGEEYISLLKAYPELNYILVSFREFINQRAARGESPIQKQNRDALLLFGIWVENPDWVKSSSVALGIKQNEARQLLKSVEEELIDQAEELCNIIDAARPEEDDSSPLTSALEKEYREIMEELAKNYPELQSSETEQSRLKPARRRQQGLTNSMRKPERAKRDEDIISLGQQGLTRHQIADTLKIPYTTVVWKLQQLSLEGRDIGGIEVKRRKNLNPREPITRQDTEYFKEIVRRLIEQGYKFKKRIIFRELLKRYRYLYGINANVNFSELGRLAGITREYARQLYDAYTKDSATEDRNNFKIDNDRVQTALSKLREQNPPQRIPDTHFSTDSAWSLVLDTMRKQVSKKDFDILIKDTVLLSCYGNTAVVVVPTRAQIDEIKDNLDPTLAETIHSVIGIPVSCYYVSLLDTFR